MTHPDYRLIAALPDRSGSMQSVADDIRGGFESYIGYTRRKRSRGAAPAASISFDDAERRRARGR